MSDIAEHTSLSKPDIYRHFAGKEVLYRAMLERQRAVVRRILIEPTLSGTSGDLLSVTARILTRVWYLRTKRPEAVQTLFGPVDWRLEAGSKADFRAEVERAFERAVAPHMVGRVAGLPVNGFSSLLFVIAMTSSDMLQRRDVTRADVRTLVRLAGSWVLMPTDAPS